MWRYEKRLQYPVNIRQTNPKLAQFIISQYGGPDGESAAAMRYLSQRYAMPYEKGKATLNDIGTEESGATPSHKCCAPACMLVLWAAAF